MTNNEKRFSITSCCILFFFIIACTESATEPTNMVDSGSWYVTGFRWPHDGNPHASEHFTVYSDAASLEARRTLAEIGEELLMVLQDQFAIGDDAFRFPTGRDKIHIFTYRNHFPREWGGWAYYGGLLIYSLDHKERTEDGHTALDMYVPVVKHELMHVIESLMKASGNPNLVDVWLTEGIAEAVSGGTAGGEIESLGKLNELTSRYGFLNPIAMHQYRYPNVERIAYYYYYPMFQLAVRYLTDQNGHGKTLRDLGNLFLDVRDGIDFATAFEDRLGLSVVDYEAQFFDLMRDYLN